MLATQSIRPKANIILEKNLMAENGSNGAPTAGVDPQSAGGQPSMAILLQYVKDLSFENPHSPSSLDPEKGPPAVELGVNVQARAGEENNFEVEIRINAKASHGENTAFVVELVYAGLFQLVNFPQETLERMCLIECPRILFPFARRIIADTTRDGGFSPLLLDPIDFATLYNNHKTEQAAQQPVGNA
jgi:preprotein translocase subunit SecB